MLNLLVYEFILVRNSKSSKFQICWWLVWVKPPFGMLSGFINPYHLATSGSNPKHTIYAYVIYIKIYAVICLCIVKRGRVWPIFCGSLKYDSAYDEPFELHLMALSNLFLPKWTFTGHFFKQFYWIKAVDFWRIRTRIVGVEGEHTKPLNQPPPPPSLYTNFFLCNKYWETHP